MQQYEKENVYAIKNNYWTFLLFILYVNDIIWQIDNKISLS